MSFVWDINGTIINPVNAGQIGVTASFGDRVDELSLNVDNLILTREDYDIIRQHNASVGYFQGIPINATAIGGVGIPNVVIEYFGYFKGAIFNSFTVELPVKKRYGSDQFWQKADGTSFELIATTTSFPIFDCPYVIIKDNQAELAVSLAITLYLMTREALEATKQLITSISDLIGAVTPNVGAGVTMDIGDIITQVIKIIFQLSYLALLIVAIVDLSKQLFELIFPKIRNFKACKVKDLLSIGCQNLGYNFSSTLLDAIPGLTILPKPLKKQSKKWFEFKQNSLTNAFNKGYPTSSDTTSTVGRLLEAIRVQFNGKVRIIGNTVHLERRDYWASITTNSLIPALAVQESAIDRYQYNIDEAWKRFYITYQSDISDLHTYDNFGGIDAEYSCEPINVVNADLVDITGYVEINIPFALGARKEKLNWLEEFVKSVFKLIDKVINTFGGNSSLVAKIENRIGVLVISQQYFQTTKMLYTVAGKQPANYLDKIRPSALFNNYHYIDRIEINGFKIRDEVPVAVSPSDFVSLLNNNYADIDGVVMEITNFDYIEDAKTMTISYREPDNYANGEVQTILING